MDASCNRCRGKSGPPVGEFEINGNKGTYCETCVGRMSAGGHTVTPVKTDRDYPRAPAVDSEGSGGTQPLPGGADDDAAPEGAADDATDAEPAQDGPTAPQDTLTFVHAGGGWYALSNGAKVKGRQAAIDAGAVPA